MNEINSAMTVLADLLVPLCLGFAVAVVRIAEHGWRGFANFMGELTLSCFYGLIMYWLLELAQLPPNVKYGITGGGVYIFLKMGNVIFARLEKLIADFQLKDFLPGWFRGKGE